MIIPMLCVTIFVILVVWFLLPRVARLMIHTPTAISIFECLSMGQLMIVFIAISFQAEDGIREYKVTGVQTCALPISRSRRCGPPRAPGLVGDRPLAGQHVRHGGGGDARVPGDLGQGDHGRTYPSMGRVKRFDSATLRVDLAAGACPAYESKRFDCLHGTGCGRCPLPRLHLLGL